MSSGCKHQWVSNSGRGGVPDFRLNRQMSVRLIMHVTCYACGDRTWFTKDQWKKIPLTPTEGIKP